MQAKSRNTEQDMDCCVAHVRRAAACLKAAERSATTGRWRVRIGRRLKSVNALLETLEKAGD